MNPSTRVGSSSGASEKGSSGDRRDRRTRGSAGRQDVQLIRVAAPADERATAFATFFAYGGYYSVDGDRVIHRVRVASVQNWVGTELIRELSLSDDRLRLRTPELLVGGVSRVTELFWERVPDADRGLG